MNTIIINYAQFCACIFLNHAFVVLFVHMSSHIWGRILHLVMLYCVFSFCFPLLHLTCILLVLRDAFVGLRCSWFNCLNFKWFSAYLHYCYFLIYDLSFCHYVVGLHCQGMILKLLIHISFASWLHLFSDVLFQHFL